MILFGESRYVTGLTAVTEMETNLAKNIDSVSKRWVGIVFSTLMLHKRKNAAIL